MRKLQPVCLLLLLLDADELLPLRLVQLVGAQRRGELVSLLLQSNRLLPRVFLVVA